MFRKPVKVTEIEIEGQRYAARYYEQKTARGSRRFSCEVTIDADRSHHRRRRLDDQPGIEGGTAGAGDGV